MVPFSFRRRAVLSLAVAVAFVASAGAGDSVSRSEPRTEQTLASYVSAPDPSFGWREVASGPLGDADYAEYLLTSQTWRGIPWKHQLFVLRPHNMARDQHQALLFIHGGRWKPEYDGDRKEADLPGEAMLFVRLAEKIGAPVAVVRQVPFQPMFDRKEDALIAYTFDQYLKTGEEDWPLLLPMVKGAVRAMDAVQSIARERWQVSLDSFTVAGASKRGWTAWLTAATDKRVMAVVPMVIDVLNMSAQMRHQRDTWGNVSEEIRDYAALDLPTRLETPRGAELLSKVDPFSYRRRLTQPKLILLSTNDRYWPLDALNLYWSELPEPKRVLYVPNQGHGLQDLARVIGAVTAAHRYAAEGRTLPKTTWSFAVKPDTLAIQVNADRAVDRVLVWTARSPTKDFRNAHWTSRECAKAPEGYACSAERAPTGYTAAFAETAFADGGELSFSTSTTVCIATPDRTRTPSC
jgi:PhoPQ-activated pathogenicity-related protein